MIISEKNELKAYFKLLHGYQRHHEFHYVEPTLSFSNWKEIMFHIKSRHVLQIVVTLSATCEAV